MKTPSGNSVPTRKGLSERDLRRLRNAMARRKLQCLHEEKVLQSRVAEVWDQPAQAGV
jgi:hypothetical protein